ncbi:galactose-3-O-sulfotransferase 3 isoform X2 [Hydra vulgaris]|uniref:Galactose-3-O-sulfotransferase 3 isoform X2 n=1 Tax=Hydra vulgaris TaxID=6087 RepID=A0ABM4CC23_HYDVU
MHFLTKRRKLAIYFITSISIIVFFKDKVMDLLKRNKNEKKCKDSELDCKFTNSTPNCSTLLYQIFQNITPGNLKAFNSGIKENLEESFYKNVIFLKTHKTGSSTVTNIIQRYAKLHHLKAALPLCYHRFCYPNKFKEAYLYEHKKGDTYNVIFNHAVFHKENMKKLMNPQSTKIITIIREPYSQFDSIAQYLNFKKHYNLSGNLPLLDEFFELPEQYLKKILQTVDLRDGEGSFALVKNPNAFDLGFDVWNETDEYIKSVLTSITRDFDLVMIMEYMEESLILLKNELNWKLEDVVFKVHNARTYKENNTINVENLRKKILNWSKLDTAIYNQFNKTFWAKVNNSAPNFYEEVDKLKILNYNLVNHCRRIKVTAVSSSLTRKYYDKTKTNLCTDVMKEEIPFTMWFKKMRHLKQNK